MSLGAKVLLLNAIVIAVALVFIAFAGAGFAMDAAKCGAAS